MSLSPTTRLLMMASNFGLSLNPNTRVLDFGCGNGSVVQLLLDKKLDAYGCDLEFKPGSHVEVLSNEGRIKNIVYQPYALPFPDQYFDLVISAQVFEHVQNYQETISELLRVTKPSGINIHLFPPKYMPIESHVFVPFSSVIRGRYWMAFWTALGFRKVSQKGRPVFEVVQENIEYLNNCTNYLDSKEIVANFKAGGFDQAFWGNEAWLSISTSRKGKFASTASRIFPLFLRVHNTFIRKILVAKRD